MIISKRLLIFCLCYFTINNSFSQYKISFAVKQNSSAHAADSLFIAGNFNSWNPANKNYTLTKENNGEAIITVTLPPGSYEYKFTRGDWTKVETNEEGKDISNRNLIVTGDTAITIAIKGWSDDFARSPSAERKNTASRSVQIIDTAFYIPQLNRKRRIWLYLPPGYSSTGKHYPVLYMHDGQNLFDEATSYSGEWGIDEYLDSIFLLGKKEVIVVGIDNGLSKRMNEYNPFSFREFGKGEGKEYVDFLVQNLKPYIDRNYRTLKNKQNTFIAGSSMGGLISFYAVLKYPQVFGGAGIFSPAFWTAPGIDTLVVSTGKKLYSKLYFYAGGKEGESMLPGIDHIVSQVKKYSGSIVKEVIDPEAEHNEAAWRKYFPGFYEWLLPD